MPEISIIIITKNRSKKLLSTIKSILRNHFTKTFEIIVIDQSHRSQKIFIKNVIYRRVKFTGKSKGINYALKLARGKIIALTDDDCIPENNWLNTIYTTFKKRSTCVVFGDVLPYSTKNNSGKFCPSTISLAKLEIIKKPEYHCLRIGYGNNLAFRKKIFSNCLKFNEGLGPGSCAYAAEDADFALKLLIQGYNIIHKPEMIVYHNRWLSLPEFKKLNLYYTCGEMACYGYYLLKGYKFAKIITLNNFKNDYHSLRKAIKYFYLRKWNFTKTYSEIRWIMLVLFYQVRGISIALIHAIVRRNTQITLN